MQTSPKKIEILACAQEMIQKRGYNGFSYADISRIVGIQKASIHHHFPSKEDLAIAVIQQYKQSFKTDLTRITNDNKDWLDKIYSYAKLYESVLQEERLCLCGMLASDIETLPENLKTEIRGFFLDNVKWLTTVLALGKKPLSKTQLTDAAWEIISSLQGAVILAKTVDKPKLFSAITHQLILQLENMQ